MDGLQEICESPEIISKILWGYFSGDISIGFNSIFKWITNPKIEHRFRSMFALDLVGVLVLPLESASDNVCILGIDFEHNRK